MYIPTHVHAVQLGNLCTPDCAAALLKWQLEDIVVVSGYMDINAEVKLPWLLRVFEHVDRFHLKLLLTLDSNAHSSFYSMVQSNA